jgi:hypothetical protein
MVLKKKLCLSSFCFKLKSSSLTSSLKKKQSFFNTLLLLMYSMYSKNFVFLLHSFAWFESLIQTLNLRFKKSLISFLCSFFLHSFAVSQLRSFTASQLRYAKRKRRGVNNVFLQIFCFFFVCLEIFDFKTNEEAKKQRRRSEEKAKKSNFFFSKSIKLNFWIEKNKVF